MNARVCLLSALLLSACGGGDRIPTASRHTEPSKPTSRQTAIDKTVLLPSAAGVQTIHSATVKNQVGEHALNDALYSAAYAEHPADREDVIEYLADRGEPGAVSALREIAMTDKVELRRAAVEALAEIGGEQSVLALGRLLDDDDAAVRVSVVEALEETANGNSIGYLQQALADSDPRVRAAAGLALEELQPE